MRKDIQEYTQIINTCYFVIARLHQTPSQRAEDQTTTYVSFWEKHVIE